MLSVFGTRLRSVRMSKKLTQQRMADMLSMTLNAYQKYEQHERMPSYETLLSICDNLDVSIDYLFGRDEFLRQRATPVDECP